MSDEREPDYYDCDGRGHEHTADNGDVISFVRRKHPSCVVRRYTDA